MALLNVTVAANSGSVIANNATIDVRSLIVQSWG